MRRGVMGGKGYSPAMMPGDHDRELVAAPSLGGTAPLEDDPNSSFFDFREGASEVLCRSRRSGFADGLEDGGGHGVGRRLAGPHDILEGGVEALALGDGHLDEIVQLLGPQAFGAPEGNGVPEHWQA